MKSTLLQVVSQGSSVMAHVWNEWLEKIAHAQE